MSIAAEYPLGPRESGSTPTEDSVAAGDPQRLTGATTTTAKTAVALPVGSYAVLQAAAGAVRWRLGSADTVEAVATDPYIPAGASRRWYVTEATRWVSVRAGAASGDYEAHVYVDASV